MEENIINDNSNLHKCNECGLHYKNKEISQKCEAWCKENKTCNVEITKQSEEHIIQRRSLDNTKDVQGELLDNRLLDNNKNLEEIQKKCDEYLNNWKRAAADLVNYKKDEMERIMKLMQYGKEDMILKILSIFDSIYLAEKSLPKDENFATGFSQITKQIDEFLKKEGIYEIKTVEEKFNPNFHEVIEEIGHSEASAKDSEPGIIIEELQKGYVMGEKVLRPAKVKVTK